MKLLGYANCFPRFGGCMFKQEEIEMSGVITWWRCVNKTSSLCSQHLYICFPVIIMPCEEALVVEWWSFRRVRSSVRPRTNTNIQVFYSLMGGKKTLGDKCYDIKTLPLLRPGTVNTTVSHSLQLPNTDHTPYICHLMLMCRLMLQTRSRCWSYK